MMVETLTGLDRDVHLFPLVSGERLPIALPSQVRPVIYATQVCLCEFTSETTGRFAFVPVGSEGDGLDVEPC